jgi:Spirocyclase AveC-like
VSHQLTPLLKAAIGFAYIGGFAFLAAGVYLTYRRRRLGGLPASVPPGYISYFVMPTLIGVAVGRRLATRFRWRRPLTLLTVGLVVGFVWAVLFNGILGARLGVFYYGRVIPGLALWQGTKHQYPLYDALAMGVMVMVFAYILGRTDPEGRTVIDRWADAHSMSRLRSSVMTIVAMVVIGNVLYGAVFAPHLMAKLRGWEVAGPTVPLFPGIPNQPLYGTSRGDSLDDPWLKPILATDPTGRTWVEHR